MCSKHILQDQIAKVFYEMLKKMILMLLLHVMTTLTKLFCLLVAFFIKISRGELIQVGGQVWEVLESW